MELKKILIVIFCFILQFGCTSFAEDDATQSQGYQNIIKKSKQINSGVQPISAPSDTSPSISAPTPISASTPITVTNPQPIMPNNVLLVPNVQMQQIAIPRPVSDMQIKYNKIIEANSNLFKNNNEVVRDYINAVEDYRKTYGDESLKYKNINNYVPILKNLGLAYENTSRINDAIATYEILQKEKPADLNIKKHLLYLYDEITSCIDAENMLSQIQKYEPNYKAELINCAITSDEQPVIGESPKHHETEPEKSTEKDSYNWNMVYLVYFSLWGIIVIFGLNLEKIKQYLLQNTKTSDNYFVKYDINNCPIKPSIEEFGFSKSTFDNTVDIISPADNFNGSSFIWMPLSMYFSMQLFSAPHFIFPIFTKSSIGVIFTLIFWLFTAFICNIIRNKVPFLNNITNIKNYNAYLQAIDLYNTAKCGYDKEMQRQKLEYERKLREQEEQKRRQEAYRRKQLEQARLEQERKQRELEEQKRNALARTLRLQENYWRKMEWDVFEHEIGELFKDLGYLVTVTKESGDGGIDAIVKKDNKVIAVQCKHYKNRVGAPIVQAFWGAKDYFEYKGKYIKADGAIMVALSGVTEPAMKIINHFPNYELWTIDTIIAKAKEANYNYKS